MGQKPYPFDLAVRAANLTERTSVVTMLGLAGCESTEFELPDLERLRINRLASKLSHQSSGRPDGHREAQEIAGILTAYRLWELDPTCDESVEELLSELHAGWLPTYRAALGAFDPADRGRGGSLWRDEKIYYGRLACACEPFLSHAEAELRDAVRSANRAAGRELFGTGIPEELVQHLLDRVQLALTWAIEADKNVYCAREGIRPQAATTEAFIAYLDEIFAERSSYHRFYLRFPVLARWLAQLTAFVSQAGRIMVERFQRDLAEIAAACLGAEINQVTSIKVGRSDSHAGGQSVGRVEVELVTGEQAAFIYKPRGVEAELATQQLLSAIARDDVIGFATYRVLAREGYGYAELIPAARNHVEHRHEADAIYEELGGYLAIFHAFGGGDLHFENLLVADGHLMVCDCETILGVRPLGQDPATGTVLDSVYKTGLLEWPRAPGIDGAAEMRLSGTSGGEPYQIPTRLPRVNGDPMSFNVGVIHEAGIEVDPGGANRVYIGDNIAAPAEFKDAVVRGFDRVHSWFGSQSVASLHMITGLFEHSEVRFINFATQVYAHLLLGVSHPKCLMDPLQADLVFNKLEEHPQRWDRGQQLAESEIAALWQLDVPIFTVGASDMQLMFAHHQPVPFALAAPPLDDALARIGRLTAENCQRQVRYIGASLSVDSVHSPEFVATALDYARRVGQKLCTLVRGDWDLTPWHDLELTAAGAQEVDILSDLYNGTAGIAFFLAYLDAFVDDDRLRPTAERALSHAVANCAGTDRIGAFQGASGLVYLLVHLAQLWHDDRLLAQAIDLSREITLRIPEDRHFDVLSGAAGVIPVMLGLSRLAPGEGLQCAHDCARHLLQHAERTGKGISWPTFRAADAVANLTGFAHGPSGMGWALISLGSATDRPDYIAAGLEAFKYEAAYFDDEQQDWWDLRTSIVAMARGGRYFANAWCNGAAGIGLSRIASWAALGGTDNELLKDANVALAATLRNFHTLGNDSLCHGRSGNSELFLRFARLKDEPAFQMEANLQAQAQWNDLEVTGRALEQDTPGRSFPGLMLGLAGLGLHFLRLAYPDQVPSPLLLDPPPGTVSREDDM